MKRNMNEWLEGYLKSSFKKPMPLLSFPGAALIGKTVEELVRSGHEQARCMKAIADKFDAGAAFSLMDLSVEAEAFGAKVIYSSDEVPTMHGALLHDEEEAQALAVPQIGAGRTGECIKGIKEACSLITDRPVIAGIIGPYSLAGRLLDMTEIMILCYEEPELVELVLEKTTQFLIEYAKAFKEAGANGIAVEDENFLFLYHNCGTVVPLAKQMEALNVKAYSFGNAVDIEEMLKVLPSDRLVIGNIDPAGILRSGTPQRVEAETTALLERCSKYPNFVLASGCDIPPQTPMDNLEAFSVRRKNFQKNKTRLQYAMRTGKCTADKEHRLTEQGGNKMAILEEISTFLQKGRSKNVKTLVTQALEEGIDPKTILNEGLIAGMSVIGGKFKRNEVFVPEVLVAARAMNAGLAILEPKLVEVGNEPIGRVVIGTVKGDLHDIGKNLTAMMLKGAGFEIIDMGVDVSAEAFLAKAEEVHADIIGMSALLSTTMPAMKELLDLMEEKGVRSRYIVMIGGAPVTDEFAEEIGADYYTPDAASAAETAKAAVERKTA